jgi:putative ABC transport system permease protein
MARELWQGQNPIGKRIRFPGSEKRAEPWRTVVGVVNNVKQYGLDKEDKMQLYLPEAQYPTSQMTLVARTSINPRTFISAIRSQIFALDKDQPVYEIATMEQLLSDSIALRHFSMLLLLVFASLALVLALIGIYGVISYSVTQRTREIGVRLALGARSSDILRMIVGQGMVLTVTGVVVGIGMAFALTRLMSSLLYGVSATDPMIFAFVPLVLAGASIASCLIPAWRATRVDPMVALRIE